MVPLIIDDKRAVVIPKQKLKNRDTASFGVKLICHSWFTEEIKILFEASRYLIC